MRFTYDRISEANIQAECYHRLRGIGIPCYLEYKVDNCRFDMVILNKSKDCIIGIVEFKSRKSARSNEKIMKTKQYQKYAKYGLPLIYCCCWAEIGCTIDIIVELSTKN